MKMLHNSKKGNQIVKVNREVEKTYPLNPLYVATLDNGVTINVYGDYAIGSDDKTYYHVGYEKDDDLLVTLGWNCEIEEAVIV